MFLLNTISKIDKYYNPNYYNPNYINYLCSMKFINRQRELAFLEQE